MPRSVQIAPRFVQSRPPPYHSRRNTSDLRQISAIHICSFPKKQLLPVSSNGWKKPLFRHYHITTAIEEPGFSSAAYRFPANYTEAAATTHADSLLTLLEGDAVLSAKFIAFEMPADFVADLRADRDALDGSNSGKHSDNFEGVESTAAIETLLGEAQDLITRLDTVMHNKYSRNPDKLLAWKSASRVERAGRKTKPDGTTPTPSAV